VGHDPGADGLLEEVAGDPAERDPGRGLTRRGALEDRAGVLEVVLLHAGQVGVAGSGSGERGVAGQGRELIGVDRVGDRRHRWGFRYDEGDGTGLDLRPALVRHRGQSTPDWVLLRLDTRPACLSAASDPNGAGDDARPVLRPGAGRHGLARALRRMEQLAGRIERRTERFDAWESCLSWLPVTEAGDAEQGFGYQVDVGLWPDRRVHQPAVDLDQSEWDDPDYQVLAFRGGDRPFGRGECGTDPGEAADRPAAGPSLGDLRKDLRSLVEDVDDLAEPVDDISRFDQCLYTVGVASLPGYLFRGPAGTENRRSALSFDMRGAQLPQLSVVAFPGEEPPQIECNEDAGGVQTDE